MEAALQEDQKKAAETLITLGKVREAIRDEYMSPAYGVHLSDYGYMEGPGYLPVTLDDWQDSQIIESLLELHQECAGTFHLGISFVQYRQRRWVIDSLRTTFVVLGIRDPNYYVHEDMARVLDLSNYP
jgi:hypothetical protein